MFRTSLGTQVSSEQAIFPLITINPNSKIWKCVGTGFFIQSLGGFVTAKHVFYDNNGAHLPTLYGVQTTSANERHLRSIVNFVTHKTADIGVGFLGSRRHANGTHSQPEIAPSFALDFTELNKNDKIKTFAFPLTKRQALNEREVEFTFRGKWEEGYVIDFLEEGSLLVRHRCYETSLNIQYGASGGPVFKDNYVVAINSSGMEVGQEESAVSYITPIDFILDLSVPDGNTSISIPELIQNGSIAVK